MDSGLGLSHKHIKTHLCVNYPIHSYYSCDWLCVVLWCHHVLQCQQPPYSLLLSNYRCVSFSFTCLFFISRTPGYLSVSPSSLPLKVPSTTLLLSSHWNGNKPSEWSQRLQYGPYAQSLEPSPPRMPVPWPWLQLLWGLAVSGAAFGARGASHRI